MKTNLSRSFKHSVTAAAVALSLGIATPALANEGSIKGTSLSQSGTVLPNVTVTIKNETTGLTRSITTDEQGNFRFPVLPPGKYNLEAKKDGFLVLKQENLRVGAVGATNVDLTLESGDIEKITVTGAVVSAIDVASSETQLVVDLEYLK